NKEFREYVVHYTNAATILRDDFKDTEDLDGFFSGWDAEKGKYDPESWLYKAAPSKNGGGEKAGHSEAGGGHGKDRGGEAQDSAIASRKYWPARRGHSGAARTCIDSRLDGCPHALRHSSWLFANAVLRSGFAQVKELH